MTPPEFQLSSKSGYSRWNDRIMQKAGEIPETTVNLLLSKSVNENVLRSLIIADYYGKAMYLRIKKKCGSITTTNEMVDELQEENLSDEVRLENFVEFLVKDEEELEKQRAARARVFDSDLDMDSLATVTDDVDDFRLLYMELLIKNHHPK
ncbi:uncharacterized protein KGF55_001383 [Candida pseudojiufengensis]|uniref:uncharacterized protein n=1 Tax=Candida pseudojiufengensis TaxID=497109 RepID=UPI00222540F8|nr:uncharacterized protein KGF55_001383 [Candida pseudojiufengensis]KAI5965163.1 hypothetical protein KGF55_001383 [Candida pseudojiufengensis]